MKIVFFQDYMNVDNWARFLSLSNFVMKYIFVEQFFVLNNPA